MSPELRSLLTDIAEYLDAHSDVADGSYGEPRPNRAMQLKTQLDELLAQPAHSGPACQYPECDCAISGPTNTIRFLCTLGKKAERRQR